MIKITLPKHFCDEFDTFNKRYRANQITPKEVEAFASACWQILIDLGIQDGHSKHYDPMSIDPEKKIAHTYVFDLWDGGRHHTYDSLEQIVEAVRKETLEAIQEYLEEATQTK